MFYNNTRVLFISLRSTICQPVKTENREVPLYSHSNSNIVYKSSLSNKSFLTSSISHSITCFLFPSYDIGKLQKYLWVVIFVIYLKHFLLCYDMLFIVPIQLSIFIMPIFNLDCLFFCDLDSWKFSPTFS